MKSTNGSTVGRRVLVCGSRDWADYEMISAALSSCALSGSPLTVVHGAAKGADSLAGQWARNYGVTEEAHPADWTGHGRAAGHIRNRLMLDLGVDYLLAFKDGFDMTMKRGGTENMVRIALAANVITTLRGHGGLIAHWGNRGQLEIGIAKLGETGNA